MEDSEPEVADEWIRCGCGNGLFRIVGELLVLRWSPRGGEHGELSLPASAAWRINRICEKCGDERPGGPIPAIDMTQPLVKELVRHTREALFEACWDRAALSRRSDSVKSIPI